MVSIADVKQVAFQVAVANKAVNAGRPTTELDGAAANRTCRAIRLSERLASRMKAYDWVNEGADSPIDPPQADNGDLDELSKLVEETDAAGITIG